MMKLTPVILAVNIVSIKKFKDNNKMPYIRATAITDTRNGKKTVTLVIKNKYLFQNQIEVNNVYKILGNGYYLKRKQTKLSRDKMIVEVIKSERIQNMY